LPGKDTKRKSVCQEKTGIYFQKLRCPIRLPGAAQLSIFMYALDWLFCLFDREPDGRNGAVASRTAQAATLKAEKEGLSTVDLEAAKGW